MTGSTHRIAGVFHRIGWKLAALAAASAVIGGASLAAAATGGAGAGKFAAAFEARAVGDPSITSCPDLGRSGQKLEGRYAGTMTIDGEEYAFNFTTLEALVDRSAGIGTAEGRWQLVDPSDRSVVGRGELIAVVTADPPSETEPPDPDLELRGMLIGSLEPPDPDQAPQLLVANFAAVLGDGATFPHLKGAVGDPSVGDPSVGDPSVGDPTVQSNPAALVPAVKC
jgi:hypothetical protein